MHYMAARPPASLVFLNATTVWEKPTRKLMLQKPHTLFTTMVSFRLTSFLALASFGLFACAKPIGTTALAAREFDTSLIARGDYPAHSCGCGQDIVDVLLNLQVEINASVLLLDGKKDSEKPCDDIIAAIQAAVDLIAKVELNVAVVAADLTAIVNIIVAIVLSIVTACGKYTIVICAQLILKLDVCLAALVEIVVKLCPGILAELGAALNVHIDIFLAVKLALTLVAGGAPCGCN